MNKIIGIGLPVFLVTVFLIACLQYKTIHDPTEAGVDYFISKTTTQAQSLPEYNQLGLGGGVDGFTLVKAYPGLMPSDFMNVNAYQGHYFEKDGKLFYEGNAASNSGVLLREGMRKLLIQTANRLEISPHNNKNIDSILKKISAPAS